MPTRVVGRVIYPDGRLKTVRYVKGQVALPDEHTLHITRFTDPVVAKAVELGGLAILYKGQADPVIRTHVKVADHWELPPAEFKLELEIVCLELQPAEQARPERRPVAQARLL